MNERCVAKTQAGHRCTRPKQEGKSYCPQHEALVHKRKQEEAEEEAARDHADNPHGLTPLQRAFVDEYLANGGNGTQAALKACNVSSHHSASARASQLLANPKVKEAVRERWRARAMDADEVMERLSHMARGTMAMFVRPASDSEGGVVVDLTSDVAMANMHLVKKVKTKTSTRREPGKDSSVEERTVEFELHDSKDALKTIGRMIGMGGEESRVEIHNHHGADEMDTDRLLALMRERGLVTDGEDE